NAPKAPTSGAINAQISPDRKVSPLARVFGILSKPTAPPPLFKNTCTIGTAKIKEVAATAIVLKEELNTFEYVLRSRPWYQTVKSYTRIKIVPGELIKRIAVAISL